MTSEIRMDATDNQNRDQTVTNNTTTTIERKPYDSLLPFLVVEALSEDGVSFKSISVRMSNRGWAWIISGRKLFIWRFKSTNQGSKTRRTLSPCYELQLPPSDLLHRADLVHVFFMPTSQTIPATIAVSPEGYIRFWSNIANDRYTEAMVSESQGQEYHTLTPLSHFEFALGTTTSSVFLLTVDDARNKLNCSMLSAPESLLSAIGRRVTNIFFGSMPSDQSIESSRPLIAVLKQPSHSSTKSDKHLLIMSSNLHLQRHNCGTPPSQLVKAWDLQESIFDHLINKLWVGSDYSQISVWPIDMIMTKNYELLILLATSNQSDSHIHYAIAKFNPNQVNNAIERMSILKHKSLYSKGAEDQLLSLRFIERIANSSLCFLYDRKYLFLTKIDGDIVDAIDFYNQQDSIMGANFVDSYPLLFTQRDGLVSISLNEVATSSTIPFDDILPEDQSQQESEIIQAGEDALSKMRLAFQEHNKQDIATCQLIIDDLLRCQTLQDKKNDINEAAFALSQEIIDDDIRSIKEAKLYGLPESTRSAFSTSYTEVDSTIKFKSDLHKLFIEFLKASTLWTELSTLERNKETISTHFALKEHGDKLVVPPPSPKLNELPDQLKWLKQIELKQYEAASVTLDRLANVESINQDKKEILLSLCKLAKIASVE